MRHVECGEFSSVSKRLIASHMATQCIATHKTFAFAVTAVCIRLTNAHTQESTGRERLISALREGQLWVDFSRSWKTEIGQKPPMEYLFGTTLPGKPGVT